MSIIRIVAVWVRGARRSQCDPGLLGQPNGLGRRAVDHLEINEVAALGHRPRRDPVLPETTGQDLVRGRELRRDALAMGEHVRPDALGVPEETGVCQLVDLVRPDGPDRRMLQVPVEVDLGGGQEGHARARERDLGGRADLEEAVRVPRLGGDRVDVRNLGEVSGERVDDVRVVPDHAEIGGSRGHPGQARDRVVVVHRAGGVGEDRHAPHALDRRIVGDEPLDHVHVRAGRAQRHRDHLDAERLGDPEVAVIAGHGAQPPQRGLVLPRALGVGSAEEHRERQRVVHDRQARVVLRDQAVGVDPQQLGEDRPQLGQAGAAAVVADVGRARGVVPLARERQETFGQSQLLRRRLAARQVQRQSLVRQCRVFRRQLRLEAGEFVVGEIGQRHCGLRLVRQLGMWCPVKT